MKSLFSLASFTIGLSLTAIPEHSKECPLIRTVEEASKALKDNKYNGWTLVSYDGKTDPIHSIPLPFEPSTSGEYAVFMDITENNKHRCGYIIWQAQDLESVEMVGKFHLQAPAKKK
jgi:hypothetical protein